MRYADNLETAVVAKKKVLKGVDLFAAVAPILSQLW